MMGAKRVLDSEEMEAFRALAADPEVTQREAGDRLGISRDTVQRICVELRVEWVAFAGSNTKSRHRCGSCNGWMPRRRIYEKICDACWARGVEL